MLRAGLTTDNLCIAMAHTVSIYAIRQIHHHITDMHLDCLVQSSGPILVLCIHMSSLHCTATHTTCTVMHTNFIDQTPTVIEPPSGHEGMFL